ncbi:hypothetical protein MMC21_002826 [Puttea exsequens]|nr:hypothetical protein [Puttea exsequens]
MLDRGFEPARAEEQDFRRQRFNSKEHARKSNAMRRILALDGAGIMTTVQRTRTLSNLGVVFKAAPKNSLPGLGNWDNSCYQNSVLQGLASLESLPAFLQQYGGPEDSRSTKRALAETIKKLNDPSHMGKTLWTPAELKSMSSWQQQDAQEYFSKISDALENEMMKELWQKPAHAGLEFAESVSPQPEKAAISRRVSDIAELPVEVSSMIVRNPLEGLLAQRVGCQRCGYVEGLSMVPFNCLTVPLGRNWMYDVRECLDEYTALEPINGVECTKCTLLLAKEQLQRLLAHLGPEEIHSTADGKVSHEALRLTSKARLEIINQALEGEDLSDSVLKKCQIPSKQRVSTTKSRQAVIARAPKSLVIHVNRSNFDELTGVQSKNLAHVRFPQQLNLGSWCLGSSSDPSDASSPETWNVDPSQSMLSLDLDAQKPGSGRSYELRAVITHYGRHENGHYICYRRSPYAPKVGDEAVDKCTGPWWRLSDEDVTEVDEDTVLGQGGVFMLFYEQKEPSMNLMELRAQVETLTNDQCSSEAANEPGILTPEPSAKEVPQPQLEKATEEQPEVHQYPTPPLSPEPSPRIEYDTKQPDNIPTNIPPEEAPSAGTAQPSDRPSMPVSKESLPQPQTPSPCSPKIAPRAPEPPQADIAAPTSPPSMSASAPNDPARTITTARESTPVGTVSMRTAAPRSSRGSGSRAGKAMGSVAGFVQAN